MESEKWFGFERECVGIINSRGKKILSLFKKKGKKNLDRVWAMSWKKEFEKNILETLKQQKIFLKPLKNYETLKQQKNLKP